MNHTQLEICSLRYTALTSTQLRSHITDMFYFVKIVDFVMATGVGPTRHMDVANIVVWVMSM